MKKCYKKYCAILRRVNTRGKNLLYNNHKRTSSNKVKTVHKIIKDTSGKTQSFETVTKINSEHGQKTDTKELANAINNFFYADS